MTLATDKTEAGCPCDLSTHPPALQIGAGLEDIPRQVADFTSFRRAMLTALNRQPALAGWRPQRTDDLGVMLVEMWAYVCDSLALYDQVIAQESYLRTAKRRASLGKLVGLLGYVPNPAVAASVKLAVLADGRKAVTLPKGTAFRSGAFQGEAPQVFEMDADAKIHPFNNQFLLSGGKPETLSDNGNPYVRDNFLLEPGTANLRAGDMVLIELVTGPQANSVHVVKAVAEIDGADRKRYKKVQFDSTLFLPPNTVIEDIKLWKTTQTASHWTLDTVPSPIVEASSPLSGSPSGNLLAHPEPNPNTFDPSHLSTPSSISSSGEPSMLNLDGLYRQIKPGQFILVAKGIDRRWFRVQQTKEIMLYVATGGEVPVNTKQGTVTIPVPPSPVPVTRIELDCNWNSIERMPTGGKLWTDQDASSVVIHHGCVEAGCIAVESKTTLTHSDSLKLSGYIDTPGDYTPTSRFLLQDKNDTGLAVTGKLDPKTGTVELDGTPDWTSDLVGPLQLFGNVISASRGETVIGEILGSGDASIPNQTFKLKKKPLTYVHSSTSDNDSGVASTLEIYVDGVLWDESPRFFKARAQDRVYIVRQNADGESRVTFGDGTHGTRLPTGMNNIIAHYRYGAGSATPPAGSIVQLGKPVKGIQGIRNPVAAFGGADADTAESIRAHAPRSALILGRAVSLQDFEAVAAVYPGAASVRAEWRWHGERQRPVAQIWCIGKLGIAENLAERLRMLSDPAVAVDVRAAQPRVLRLSLAIQIDDRYDKDTVLSAIFSELMNPITGLLAPANIGIGRPLFRSRIHERVLRLAGCVAVSGIQHNGVPFTALAIDPGAGSYFDLQTQGAGLILNGREYPHG